LDTIKTFFLYVDENNASLPKIKERINESISFYVNLNENNSSPIAIEAGLIQGILAMYLLMEIIRL